MKQQQQQKIQQTREELKFGVLKSGNTFTELPFTGVNTKYRKVIYTVIRLLFQARR